MNRSRQADIDEKIDELYGLPLEEFTAARNALAKEHPEVKSLAKPSLAAWAANQAVRREPAAVKDLLAATERLRDAYAAGGADLRAATQAERDAVRQLDEAAEAALREAGRNPSTGLANKIRDTFR